MNHSSNLVFVVDENGNFGKFTGAAKMIHESQNDKFLFGIRGNFLISFLSNPAHNDDNMTLTRHRMSNDSPF